MSQWKNRILKLAKGGELGYARHLCEQIEKRLTSEESRLKSDGVSREEMQEATGDLLFDLFEYRDEYERLLSAKWVRNAWKLHVPIPPQPLNSDVMDDPSGYWRSTHGGAEWILSHKGINYVRREVLKVQKENRDRWFPWLTLVLSFGTALAALIISIINLLSG